MAVETNKGGDAPISPAQTLTGVTGVTAAGTGQVPQVAHKRRKRPSSLLAAATSLPSVETSLDEFIARANQTLSDPSEWRAAEENAKQEDEHRREADALRWKAAEQQLREGEAREQSLRRQLDGLQGRLAEAEAGAAVATNGTQDGVVADLKVRLTRSEERLYSAEERANHLAQELVAAKAAAAAAPAPSTTAAFFREGDAGDAEERIRIAEAKAAKAIAAAKAASAGLTVSPADIAAIESGLVVTSHEPTKGTNWLAVFGAFVGGLAIMFGVSKLVLSKDTDTKAAAAVVEPVKADTPPPAPAPSKPIVTPIEDDKPAAPDKNAAAPDTAAPDKNAAPDKTAPDKTAPNTAPDKNAAVEEPTIDPTPAKKATAKKVVVAPKATPKKAPAKAPAKANGGIADPFATDSAPAKKAPAKQPKQADKKPASAIVDPF